MEVYLKDLPLPNYYTYKQLELTEDILIVGIANIQDVASFEKWMEAYSIAYNNNWRIKKTYTHVGIKNLFKKVYRCQHNVNGKKKLKNIMVNKHTNCPATLSLVIQNKEYPARIIFQKLHNHIPNYAETIVRRKINPVSKKKSTNPRTDPLTGIKNKPTKRRSSKPTSKNPPLTNVIPTTMMQNKTMPYGSYYVNPYNQLEPDNLCKNSEWNITTLPNKVVNYNACYHNTYNQPQFATYNNGLLSQPVNNLITASTSQPLHNRFLLNEPLVYNTCYENIYTQPPLQQPIVPSTTNNNFLHDTLINQNELPNENELTNLSNVNTSIIQQNTVDNQSNLQNQNDNIADLSKSNSNVKSTDTLNKSEKNCNEKTEEVSTKTTPEDIQRCTNFLQLIVNKIHANMVENPGLYVPAIDQMNENFKKHVKKSRDFISALSNFAKPQPIVIKPKRAYKKRGSLSNNIINSKERIISAENNNYTNLQRY